MRAGVIQRVLSRLLWFAAASLAVPLLYSLGNREPLRIWLAWASAGVIAALLAYGVSHLPAAREAPRDSLRRREGFLAVVLGWMTMVFFTALAFYVTGEFVGFAEAFFESMSGFTTTGATIVTNIEALPDSIKVMRSFSHWIGGMGIIVLTVAILPELAVGGMQLFASEASGVEADKLAPRIAATARRLWGFYLGVTFVMVLFLWPAIGLFDAVNHAMSTIATGGFSTRDASVGAYGSLYVDAVFTFFMFLGGITFTLQFRAIRGRPGPLLRSREVRLYAALIASAVALVTLNLMLAGGYEPGEALRSSAFTVVSIATTSGFVTDNFDVWPDFSRVLLVILMLIGGCAGSTSGGSKMLRLYVVSRHAAVQLRRLVRPRLVQTLELGEREVSRETTESILGFYLLAFAAIMLLSLGMTALGMDIVSGTTASISMMNSIGPGLGTVGAADTFADVPTSGLYLLSFGMLLGRLEIYPVLVIFTAHFWRRG